MSIDREMLMLTPDGYEPVEDFSGTTVRLWNGAQWINGTVHHVGQERCVRLFLTLTRSYGEAVGRVHYIMTIDVSPSTQILLEDGKERAAFDLEVGDRLAPWMDARGTLYTAFVRVAPAMCEEAVDVYRVYPPCDCVVNQILMRFHTAAA